MSLLAEELWRVGMCLALEYELRKQVRLAGGLGQVTLASLGLCLILCKMGARPANTRCQGGPKEVTAIILKRLRGHGVVRPPSPKRC